MTQVSLTYISHIVNVMEAVHPKFPLCTFLLGCLFPHLILVAWAITQEVNACMCV